MTLKQAIEQAIVDYSNWDGSWYYLEDKNMRRGLCFYFDDRSLKRLVCNQIENRWLCQTPLDIREGIENHLCDFSCTTVAESISLRLDLLKKIYEEQFAIDRNNIDKPLK